MPARGIRGPEDTIFLAPPDATGEALRFSRRRSGQAQMKPIGHIPEEYRSEHAVFAG